MSVQKIAKRALSGGLVAGAIGAFAALLGRKRDFYLYPTHSGLARIYTIAGEDGVPVRVLECGGAFQSATYLDEKRFTAPFAYLRSFDRMFEAPLEQTRVLMLGAGGFAWPKHVLSRHENITLDVVELDHAIEMIARRWFFLDELEKLARERLRIFIRDAQGFLVESTSHYSAIVDDVFRGDVACGPTTTPEGCKLLHEHLVPGGLVLANVVVLAGSYGELRERIELLEEHFAHVYLLDASDATYSDDENYLLIASDGNYNFEGDLLS